MTSKGTALLILIMTWAVQMGAPSSGLAQTGMRLAQDPGPSVTFSPAITDQVFALLSLDCGVSEELMQFHKSIESFSVDVSPLLLQVAELGMPQAIRESTMSSAGQRYDRRQQWLLNQGDRLFDRDTITRGLQKTRNEYVEDVLRRTNLRYRDNAIQGLERIGKDNAIAVLARAAEQEESLQILARQAIDAIRKRK